MLNSECCWIKKWNKYLDINDFSLSGGKSDILKLVLCYMIVILHTIDSHNMSPILRCAVPFFFMISSYFFFSKVNKCTTLLEEKVALYGYVKRNLQLYLFWTLLFLPFIAIFRGWVDQEGIDGIYLMIRDVVFSGTFPASWYIIASVWGTVFIYYSSRYLPQYLLWLICALSYIFCVLSSNYGQLFEHLTFYESFCRIFSAPYNSILVSFMWILIGKYLAENKISMTNQKASLLLFISFVMLFIEHIAIDKFNCAVTDDCYIFLVPFCFFYYC